MTTNSIKPTRGTAPNRATGRRTAEWLAVAFLGFIAHNAKAGQVVTPSAGQNNPWLQEHLLNSKSQLPFSFVYGRQSSEALLKAWSETAVMRQLDAGRTEHTLVWTDQKTGLHVRLTAVEYAGSPVVEWTEYFRNDGKLDTPILEDVQPLDLSLPLTGSGIPMILYSNGCGGMDTYALHKYPLNQLDRLRLSNEGGGKTVTTIPFFDIQTGGGGLIGAVGWPGQWAISISRPTAGRLWCEPAWKRRTCRSIPARKFELRKSLLLPWNGDGMDAHNLLRRHILKYHTPQYDGKPVVLPISHWGWGGMKTSTSLRLLDQITKENIGFENFWMDAGWYGTDRPVEEFQVFGREDWFLYAGDWRVNKVPHPNGLRPISDAVHAKGMKFLLWFEPERAVVGTPLTIQHPEWFIGEEQTNLKAMMPGPWLSFACSISEIQRRDNS